MTQRARILIRHPVAGNGTLETVNPGALVDVAISRGATQITVLPLCHVEGCTHPPQHDGPHRFEVSTP